MQLKNLEIDLLRTFVEVAYTRNFTRAAERLNRVQSAVSSQIKRLEELAEARLLDRTRRSVKLTKEGEVLLEYAERMLRLNDAALSDLGFGIIEERVRIGVADCTTHFITLALTRFAQTHPNVQVDIYCDRSRKIVDTYDAGDLDLAVVIQDRAKPSGEAVRREPLVWAAVEGSDAMSRNPLPLAIFEPGCPLHAAAISALDRAGRRWRTAYTSPGRDGLLVAIRAGLAITIAPASAMEQGLMPVAPHYGLPELPDMTIALMLSERTLTTSGTALADVIRETLKEPAPVREFARAIAV
jgi:DNA-binding transcriptional LysR family regulator